MATTVDGSGLESCLRARARVASGTDCMVWQPLVLPSKYLQFSWAQGRTGLSEPLSVDVI